MLPFEVRDLSPDESHSVTGLDFLKTAGLLLEVHLHEVSCFGQVRVRGIGRLIGMGQGHSWGRVS